MEFLKFLIKFLAILIAIIAGHYLAVWVMERLNRQTKDKLSATVLGGLERGM